MAAPPIVHIPHEVITAPHGHKAYSKALEENHGVVLVPRQGRMETIIGHQHVYDVLTDSKHFSFDQGVVRMLHMEFMLWFKEGTFVSELDGLVQSGVQARLGAVVGEVAPILQKGFEGITDGLVQDEKGVYEMNDIFERTQRIIAEAMIILILGHDHVSSAMIEHFTEITSAIARLSGFYEEIDGWRRWNTRWLYRTFTAFCVLVFTIIPRLLFSIIPELWRTRQSHLRHGLESTSTDFTPLFDSMLARHWRDTTSLNSLGNFLWCMVCTLGIIFASIHQTVTVTVWVIIQLALKQDEYLEPLRAEWNTQLHSSGTDASPQPTVKSLNNLVLLDSFIREVMRTKGDFFGPVRITTTPVRVGRYLLPKDSICLPFNRDAHEHADNYGSSGTTFDGFQWAEQGRPAVQGSESFLSFGLGRWACPGKHLAINEIKMSVSLLFSQFEVKVKDGRYEILDHSNTTSLAPRATLQLRRR